jgi:hypothetical protein
MPQERHSERVDESKQCHQKRRKEFTSKSEIQTKTVTLYSKTMSSRMITTGSSRKKKTI